MSWNAHGDGSTEEGRGDDRREVHCGRLKRSSPNIQRPVGNCNLLLKTREVEALMFEWKSRVGLRDSYRHLLTDVRLHFVQHKGVGDISDQAWKPGNVTVRAKSVRRVFS